MLEASVGVEITVGAAVLAEGNMQVKAVRLHGTSIPSRETPPARKQNRDGFSGIIRQAQA